MKRTLAVGALMLAGSIGHAEAATITFEDLAVAPGSEVVFNSTDAVSGGFLFDAASHSHVANQSWGTDNGSTFMVLDDFLGPDALTISQVGGAPFALTSLDVSEANAPFFTARQIEVTGNLAGGGTISTVLQLNLDIVDGVSGNYFQTFLFDAGWANLTSVVLNGVGGLGGGNYYAIDNLVVGAGTQVPEPGTLCLLGLGSAWVFGRRRARRSGRL